MAPALACTCVGSTSPSEWARDLTHQAASVGLAQIDSVTSPDNPGGVYSARLTVLERFKGNGPLPEVKVGSYLCQDVELKAPEKRVVFLDKDGVVLGCSAYFISTEKLVNILRKQKSR